MVVVEQRERARSNQGHPRIETKSKNHVINILCRRSIYCVLRARDNSFLSHVRECQLYIGQLHCGLIDSLIYYDHSCRTGLDRFSVLVIFRFSFKFRDSIECHQQLRLQFESPLLHYVYHHRDMQLILCCGTDLRIKRIVLQAGIYINRLLDHPPEGSVLLGCCGCDDCRSVHLLLFFLLFGYFSGICILQPPINQV